ncbi:MAG: hypothetical protein COB12_05490 [Flavobacterium sp.]|nr:MAG: hypothetical protein COB12_05490 [Flavobacterium sp.]
MKIIYVAVCVLFLSAFTSLEQEDSALTNVEITETVGSSFTLINDTKEKVSIYTGSGFVTLNKGSKTNITCKVGKEVRWAEKGMKKDVIFKIKSDMCGETLKLSKLM